MRRWLRLPGRVPLRLRVFFRGAFALLALATIALAVNVLQDEKQRSLRTYADGLRKSQAQIVARLRHPTGQLALLNPEAAARPATPVRPLKLPFSAIDFDDRYKAWQAAEMAGCLLQYPDGASLCAGVGHNPYAGGYLYVVAAFASGALTAHVPGDLDLSRSHRVHIEVAMAGQTSRWVAPFEMPGDAGSTDGVRGRLVGFDDDMPITPASRPSRDFRGWLWQEGRCLDAAAADDTGCLRRTFVSVRMPVEPLRAALWQRPLVWPPAALDTAVLHLRVSAPGDGAPVFDSDVAGAALPYSLAELQALLLPGETLRVLRTGAAGQPPAEVLRLAGARAGPEPAAPLLEGIVRRLPPAGDGAPIEARDTIATPLGRYEAVLTGDVRSVDHGLAAVATRVSWFVGAMLLAIAITWAAIELGIIRRITLLTKRAAAVSLEVRGTRGVPDIDLSELRGSDELGVLAQGLKDLLRRVGEDVRREQIRAEQEKDLWHAVGHEIVSPLQSLMALHTGADDASRRYISRMQQAVGVLYGQASPSEAIAATTLAPQPLDLGRFLAHVAANAPHAGIERVAFEPPPSAVWVQADEYSLEDAVTHVLRNADRYRPAGSTIRIELESPQEAEAVVRIVNPGPPIDAGMLDKIFEYGVSDAAAGGAEGQRGQGLFVARTYMAKMGGTIVARNVDGGVAFVLSLPRVAAPA